jgi:hypothetical protein
MREVQATAQQRYTQAMAEKDKQIESLEKQFSSDEDMDKQRIANLLGSMREVESHYQERLFSIETQNGEERDEIEKAYHHKLNIEYNRYSELQQAREEQLTEFAEVIN